MASARSGWAALRGACHRPKAQWPGGGRVVGRLLGNGLGRRKESTTGSFDDLVAALEGQEDVLAAAGVTTHRLATHARPLPISPSYFTLQPHFNDSYVLLQDLFRRYGKLPAAPPDKIERVAWKTLRDYQMASGESVKASLYNASIAIAKQLHRIHPQLRPPGVMEAIEDFKRDINPHLNVAKPVIVDKFGRALGVGRRKTSVARAWVVEGTGEVQINGKSLSEAFGRVHDRESATWALRATERMSKYNVWALVGGGGPTGQAEALALAVAKGLAAHEPALKTALRRGKRPARSAASAAAVPSSDVRR